MPNPGPRVDSMIQTGAPGTFNASLTLPAGDWVIRVHAKVDGLGYHARDLARTIK